MVRESSGHSPPMFKRKLVMTVLIIASAGVVFGTLVVVLIGQPVL